MWMSLPVFALFCTVKSVIYWNLFLQMKTVMHYLKKLFNFVEVQTMKTTPDSLPEVSSEEVLKHLYESITIAVHYITYRIELAVFDFTNAALKEINDVPMSWQEFTNFLASFPQLIQVSKNIVKRAMDAFPDEKFDFSNQVRKVNTYPKAEDKITVVVLFKNDEAVSLIQDFLTKTKHAYFAYLCATRKTYQWEQFQEDLTLCDSKNQAPLSALMKALADLDYKAYLDDPKILKALQ